MTTQALLSNQLSLSKLKRDKDGDYKGYVHLVDEVESTYAQLE